MNTSGISIFKKAPFVRLLLPLIAGIILQWYARYSLNFIVLSGICFAVAFIAFNFLPHLLKYKLKPLQGLPLSFILLCLGLLITYEKDIRNDTQWFGNIYKNRDSIIVSINEPLHIKSSSYKADAIIEEVIHNGSIKRCKGRILLYFNKDGLSSSLNYGDRILIAKPVQGIRNLGNPAEFDYKQYSSFRQTYHTVSLGENDWVPLHQNNGSAFRRFIISTRQRILTALRNNIDGRTELAIAEALLVGYRDDLDSDIVMAYNNTGVVHIIAISGLHLGVIYLLLAWLFNKIPVINRIKPLRLLLLLSSLWLFAFVTGAGPSVLRAAVMFSFIIVGEGLGRRYSIYNSLAASAFILLCFNPFMLWDIGFQLSYLAVTGIVIFQKPVYNLLYFDNKLFGMVWKLMSVSIAAQLLTFPICLYYFHQFPLFFITTNIIVIPLTALILYLEVLLVLTYPIQVLAFNFGRIVELLISAMNKLVLLTSRLPFAIWNYIPATVFSTILLYGIILGTGYWLMNKSKTAFKASLIGLAFFTTLIAYTKWTTARQHKLIVYNIPRHKAIDIATGNDYAFIGDDVFSSSSVMENYYLKPARTAFRLNNNYGWSDSLKPGIENVLTINNKRILLIDTSLLFRPVGSKTDIDEVIMSKNPKVTIPEVDSFYKCKQYIFDGSNSMWKIEQWKKDCERLHLPFHSVPEQGAFVKDL